MKVFQPYCLLWILISRLFIFFIKIMKNKYNLKNKTISEIANWVHDHIKGDRPERIAIEQ